MKIDIHRHGEDTGTADRIVRNLFHNQADEIVAGNYYSMGLHPWQVSADTLEKDIELVRKCASNKQIIAIGEAGIDKAIKTSAEVQRNAFEQQIRIAVEADKPMIIHCVRAYNEILEYKIRSHHEKPWIVHWFSASREVGEQLIEKGFYLSFGHMLFNERSKTCQAFSYIPPEHIFLETDDAGYTIDEVYKRAAMLRNIPLQELENQIALNFNQCFKILP
jgi:TatD DNase family protein